MSSQSTQQSSPPQYWNREAYASVVSEEWKDAPLVKEARIVSLAFPGDINNAPLEAEGSESELPEGARLLQVGGTLEDLDLEALRKDAANVAFVSPGVTRETLAAVIEAVPSLEFIQSRSAGIDVLTSETLANSGDNLVMTNAKGAYSSTLAEYTMMACSYFAKDLPRLLKNHKDGKWEKYCIKEIRGATLGVVGYGDIGRAAAKLAKAYGMKVIALRKNVPSPEAIAADPCCDVVYGSDQLNQLFAESDYVVCAAPLTAETDKMIGKAQFDSAKKDCVFINVGRGPIVDEPALIEALQDGRLKGAGLDVFTVEPLEEDSPLWKLENVLLSP
jgi:phosphoglycerate dehydrogenase-like enzyme